MKFLIKLSLFSFVIALSFSVFSQESQFHNLEVTDVPGSRFNDATTYTALSKKFKEKVIEMCGANGSANIKDFSYSVETPDSLVDFTTLELSEEESDFIHFHGYQTYKLSAQVKCPE